jgi:F-type H+-transporting ATPase subunit delta
MENRALAHRYAKALLKLDPSGSVEADVELMHESLHRSRHVIMVFLDPMVLGSIKLKALRNAFGSMNPILSNFLDFIQQKNRIDHLPLILAIYLHLRRKERGLIKGHIRSAIPLDSNQVKAIEAALGRRLDKTCEFESSVDSRLIGGFTVQIEDTVYDCSVRTQLDSVRSRFLNIAG